MSRHIVITTTLFIGLAVAAGILLIVAASYGDAFGRAVLLQMGCTLFGSGLTVFLVRLLAMPTSR